MRAAAYASQHKMLKREFIKSSLQQSERRIAAHQFQELSKVVRVTHRRHRAAINGRDKELDENCIAGSL